MTRRRFFTLLACSSMVSAVLCGCSGHIGNETLEADKYYRAQPPGTVESRHVLMDKPESPLYNNVKLDLLNPDDKPLKLPGEEGPRRPGESVTEVSGPARELARQSIEGDGGATTAPATTTTSAANNTRAPVSNGKYMTVGAVVVTVNDVPIYADKVLYDLRKLLASEAKQRDPQSFEALARSEIIEHIHRLVNNELVYAQAVHTLDAKELDFAERMTMAWRQQEIAANGGSLEKTRAAYTAEARDFDQALQDKKRESIVAIYVDKKLRPRIQVTAEDMRRYYDRHTKDLFGEPEQVQFRLIKIAVQRRAGREDALKKITDLRDRIKKGEDFATLASQFNDDTRLAKTGGLEQPIGKGTYANEKLEAAVWNVPVGEISDIIESGNAFYLAKVEMKKAEHIKPFEDPLVQAQIKDALSKEQMDPMIRRDQARLLSKKAISPEEPLIDPVVEMAMQKYVEWRAK